MNHPQCWTIVHCPEPQSEALKANLAKPSEEDPSEDVVTMVGSALTSPFFDSEMEMEFYLSHGRRQWCSRRQ